MRLMFNNCQQVKTIIHANNRRKINSVRNFQLILVNHQRKIENFPPVLIIGTQHMRIKYLF